MHSPPRPNPAGEYCGVCVATGSSSVAIGVGKGAGASFSTHPVNITIATVANVVIKPTTYFLFIA